MGVYNYIAADTNGNERKGVLEGDSERHIRQQLRDSCLVPLEVTSLTHSKTENKHAWSSSKKSWAVRISTADLALLTRQFATILASGSPVEECLSACAQQIEKTKVKNVLLAVRSKVMEGYSLATGLDEFPKSFPKVYRATVAAGEQTGHLDTILLHLADYIEKQHAVQQKIKQASVYPLLMTVVSLAIVIFLLSAVVPSMIDIFRDNHAELPLLTKVLLIISDGVINYGWYIVLFVCVSAFAIYYSLQRPDFRKKIHRLRDKTPLIGRLVRSANSERFTRTLGILVKAGVSIVDAFHIAAALVTSVPMREAILQASKQVSEGISIHGALKKTGYFQAGTLQFIANGESSGRLQEMLQRAAENQQRQLTMVVESTLTLFEPLLIIIMGSIVLFIVLAVLLPMFEVTQMIG